MGGSESETDSGQETSQAPLEVCSQCGSVTQASARDAKAGLRPAACREGQLRSNWLWTDLVLRAVKAELWRGV